MSSMSDTNLDSGDDAHDHRQFWCDVCSIDLQSSTALAQHKLGRKHTKKAYWQSLGDNGSAATSSSERPAFSSLQQPLDEAELFQGLASGRYRNVVVLTGAGVSTAAGIPDFRSPGGVFDQIRQRFNNRFPPEYVLSRSFATEHPKYAEELRREVLDPFWKSMSGVMPTATHEFCAWLHRRGMLRRVYTQNIDGLHIHPSLGMPSDLVVECHGSFNRSLVMYGDPLPQRFYDCCNEDFSPKRNIGNDAQSNTVDLVMVFGTSLQVAPFCAVPNMIQRGMTRVLVNRNLDDCITNSFSKQTTGRRSADDEQHPHSGIRKVSGCRIGSRKNVPLRSLWFNREGNKKWRQLAIEEDCDSFVKRFFDSGLTTRGT